jgi:hypothetical protein
MPDEEKGEMQPEKWINPEYFEFTQPEYSAIMTEAKNSNNNVSEKILI